MPNLLDRSNISEQTGRRRSAFNGGTLSWHIEL
jgi:hypothetical protein